MVIFLFDFFLGEKCFGIIVTWILYWWVDSVLICNILIKFYVNQIKLWKNIPCYHLSLFHHILFSNKVLFLLSIFSNCNYCDSFRKDFLHFWPQKISIIIFFLCKFTLMFGFEVAEWYIFNIQCLFSEVLWQICVDYHRQYD